MKVWDVMTKQVVKIGPEETADVAARLLTHYNIGALPVCTEGGRLLGMVTDRDLVIRCIAANKPVTQTKVRQIMTNGVSTVKPDTDLAEAARLMGTRQVRRLPVVEQGKLCGMISVADLADDSTRTEEIAGSLSAITANIRQA